MAAGLSSTEGSRSKGATSPHPAALANAAQAPRTMDRAPLTLLRARMSSPLADALRVSSLYLLRVARRPILRCRLRALRRYGSDIQRLARKSSSGSMHSCSAHAAIARAAAAALGA